MAWRDQIASERRIRAVTYTSGRWSPAITLASGLSTLDDLTLSGRNPTYVRWNLEGPTDWSEHLDDYLYQGKSYDGKSGVS